MLFTWLMESSISGRNQPVPTDVRAALDHGQRAKTEIAARLNAFIEELTVIRILDPACGKEVRVFGATETGLSIGFPSCPSADRTSLGIG